jgi:arylsulfatase A-like enzyme
VTVGLPPYRIRAVHLVAVWAYAVSQPVFTMLESNPEFLVVRGATRLDVVMFALVVALLPPACAIALEWVAGSVSSRAADLLHVVMLGLFVAPLALRLLKELGPEPPAALFGTIALSSLVVAAYLRWKALRSFLTLSIALPVVGIAVFVGGTELPTNDAEAARIDVPRPSPVVVLILDEFPVASLMTSRGEVDAIRYPNFARLAAGSTWYPRATTVHDHTTGAVPAILTGKMPRRGRLPTLKWHPRNLFTLLAGVYRMRVQESLTYLCPERCCRRPREPAPTRLAALFSDTRVAYLHRMLPRSLSKGLPPIGDRWSGFAQERILVAPDARIVRDVFSDLSDTTRAQVDRFLAGISGDEPRATLHFAHLVVPHSPWRFLPSGRAYPAPPEVEGVTGRGDVWVDDAWTIEQAYQRHLLQVGFVDRIVGRLLDRLEREGVYDRALLVVVADHGASFAKRGPRRAATPYNLAEIARVPLFVKTPFQHAGRKDPRPAQTIDILPTVADVLDIRLPWPVDGRSLLADPEQRRWVTVNRHNGPAARATVSSVDRGMGVTLRLKSAWFGEGRRSLFTIGAHTSLLGRQLTGLDVRTASEGQVAVDNPQLFERISPSSLVLPVRITGTVDEPGICAFELAIAVNGRVAALTRCDVDGDALRFRALVPESIFRAGQNPVDVFAIRPRGASERLVQVGSTRG